VGEQSWWSVVGEFFTTNWSQRARWTLLCAAFWVALEMVVGRFLSGFPWNFLGVSQYRMVPLIQIASVTGVYGVSFIVVWLSISLAVALLRIVRQPGLRWGWLLELRLALIVLIGVMVFGLNRLLQPAQTDRELKVALVQPAIPQTLLWDHREDANRFDKIMDLSKRALAAGPDLLIWPESSMPNFTEDNFRAMTNLIVAHKVWMILGADDAERRPGATGPGEYENFNAAFLLSPEGKYVARYHKQHLVVFGEYLPFARRLPFLRRILPIPGDFTPGGRPVPFELDAAAAVDGRRTRDGDAPGRRSQTAATGLDRSNATSAVRLSVLICFEDVVPGLARRSAGSDIDFLLNLTNDGWFGESAAQWQQAANAVFRAVENGLPLVRCTNNGLTCWIDSRGAIRGILSGEGKAVYAQGFMTAKIPIRPAGQKREPTFYHRHGDWFGWVCVALSVVVAVRSFLPKVARQDTGV
ncbi:MAG: apolipoprotein N-acyltransferase, partial [Verrucomicrobia bacterium]